MKKNTSIKYNIANEQQQLQTYQQCSKQQHLYINTNNYINKPQKEYQTKEEKKFIYGTKTNEQHNYYIIRKLL